MKHSNTALVRILRNLQPIAVIATLSVFAFQAQAQASFEKNPDSAKLIDGFRLSLGNNCSPVRLDLAPQVMSKVPVQDQHELGLCAAFTATQMIDGWLLKNENLSRPITSPYPLALQHSMVTGRNMFQNGASPYTILLNANKYRLCSYKRFNLDLKVESYEIFLKELLAAQTNSKTNEAFQARASDTIAKAGFQNFVNFSTLDDHRLDANHLKNIAKIVETLCIQEGFQYASLPVPDVIVSSSFGNAFRGIDELRKVVDDRLTKKRTPSSITYCADALKNPDSVTMRLNGRLDKSLCLTDTHASTVVGRRVSIYTDPETKEKTPFCQYLVRNSKGTSCSQFLDDKDMNPSDKCVNGQIWMDETTLFLNTSDVVWLPDRDEK